MPAILNVSTKENLRKGSLFLMKKKESKPVAFRLDSAYIEQLEVLAERDGVTVNEKSRRILQAALDGVETELQTVRIEMTDHRSDFKEFQEGMADFAEILLRKVGFEDIKAKAFVDLKLRKG